MRTQVTLVCFKKLQYDSRMKTFVKGTFSTQTVFIENIGHGAFRAARGDTERLFRLAPLYYSWVVTLYSSVLLKNFQGSYIQAIFYILFQCDRSDISNSKVHRFFFLKSLDLEECLNKSVRYYC